MKLIVGLGNYGAEYAGTRHNIGFMTIDKIAEKLNVAFTKEKFHAKLAETNLNGEKVMLMKPLTYMNKSGLAVAEAVNFFKLDLTDILVIHDDMDLPCGLLKVKKKGSAGGHRGIGDIIAALGSEGISRIKIGIAHPLYDSVVDYVLKPFNESELQLIAPTLDVAVAAALYWLQAGTQETMNVYNGYGKAGAQKPKTQNPGKSVEKSVSVKAEAAVGGSKDLDNFDEGQLPHEKSTENPKFLAMLKNFFGSDK